MRFNRLDLNLLVSLDVLLEEKNTTRAAARLNVSQSALSGMLARLRDFFEDELLRPVGRNLEWTPLGARLAEPVRDLILQIQATVAIRPSFDPCETERHLRITASDYVIQVFLGRMLSELKRRSRRITVEILPQTEDSGEKLRRGETDFLVIPERFLAEDHPHATLYEDAFVCVAWKGNDAVGESLDLETFKALGHAAPMLGRPREPTLDGQHLRQQGIERRVEVVTSDFGSIPHVLVGTNLVATMHHRQALAMAPAFDLRLLEPPMALPAVRECLQWHRYQQDDPAHRWVRELMFEVAASLPTPAPLAHAGVRRARAAKA